MPLTEIRFDSVPQGLRGMIFTVRGGRFDESALAYYAQLPPETRPPAVAFQESPDSPLYIADGHHGIEVASRREEPSFKVDIRPGTRRDAMLYAIKAHQNPGLPRTNADKRMLVNRLLDDPAYDDQSDAFFARCCQVSRPMVAGLRKRHPRHRKPKVRMGLDGKLRKFPVPRRKPDPTPKTRALSAIEQAREQLRRSIAEAEHAESILQDGSTRKTIASLNQALLELDIWETDLLARSPFPPMPDPNDLTEDGRVRTELYRIARMKESDVLDYARRMLSHDRAHLQSRATSHQPEKLHGPPQPAKLHGPPELEKLNGPPQPEKLHAEEVRESIPIPTRSVSEANSPHAPDQPAKLHGPQPAKLQPTRPHQPAKLQP